MNYKRSILMIKQTHGATPTSDMDIGASQSLFVMWSWVRAFFFKRKLLLELSA